jgi:hypothetical protein
MRHPVAPSEALDVLHPFERKKEFPRNFSKNGSKSSKDVPAKA